MSKHLIIVESPTKIKTLKKFLGKDYDICSSVGHIIDLPTKGFGIDFDNDFEPEYQVLPDKKDVIKEIKSKAKNADVVYLAPDPDREGEAIAWHIASILPAKTKCKRIAFNSITKDAVEDAIANPRTINQSLVDAQQARRLLDRIVGYKISPLIHRRIQRSKDGFLSAGRVQSVALKLVVDREKEIEAFEPVEFWLLSSLLKTKSESKSFEANLTLVGDKKIVKEDPDKGSVTIPNEEQARKLESKLQSAVYTVDSVDKKEKKRHPVPPFITSSMQQEASRHYGFSASKTMSVAQSLYEGVDLGKHGTEGLITYMRTDSVRIAPEALKEARDFVLDKYGDKYLPKSAKVYSTKASAQDAHECIRPTHLHHDPEKIKSFLSIDQYRLYSLIWKRFLSSQMMPAIYDTVAAVINTDQQLTLKATGSMLKFNGFLVLYQELDDDADQASTDKEMSILPAMEPGDTLSLLEVNTKQSFTKPPPRFTEAALIKQLEKSGIGRPSTYASIMQKIHGRQYTRREKNTMIPTDLGRVLCQMLEENFQMIMNIDFTAGMEEKLDKIAESEEDWKEFLKKFWKEFLPQFEQAEKEAFVPKIETEKDCPDCGAKLLKIWAKDRYFYGCSKYPDCKYTAPIEALDFDRSEYADGFDWDQQCPKCSKDMKVRHGRYGAFLGCVDYPTCKGIVNIPKKGEDIEQNLPKCPAKGCPGNLTARRTRQGKIFYACDSYPDCDVIGNSTDEVLAKYKGHPRTAAVKRTGGRRGEMNVSKELKAVIGKDKITRGDLMKKIWEYIKKHDLQDEKDKRLIVPDAKLEKVFGSKEPVHMLKLAGVLKNHLS